MTQTEQDAGLPWWPAERTAHQGAERLTRARIVQAAMRLIDEEGLDALSMRRLGNALDAGATSLYWHVANKDLLLDLVLDEIFGEVQAEIVPAIGWRDQIAECARAMRRVLIRHKSAAQMLGTRVTVGPKTLDALEWMLTRLMEGGFDRYSAILAYNAVVNFACGWAVLENRLPTGPEGEGKTMEEVDRLVLEMVKSLPRDRFPNLVATAHELSGIDEEERFEFGLKRLLDGIAANK